MIGAHQAAQAAVQFCNGLFGNTANHLLLEEVELSEDEKHWFITVGFDGPASPQTRDPITEPLHSFMPQLLERKYKVVDVDAQTGIVRAVKMRQPLERIS